MILAVDPGSSSGAMVSYDPKDQSIRACNMPKTMTDLWRFLKDGGFTGVILEKVGSSRPGNAAKAAHTFAEHCGALKMGCVAAEIPLLAEPVPQKWMRELFNDNYPKGSESSQVKARKDFIYNQMQRRLPLSLFTKRQADAVAIMMWWLTIKEGVKYARDLDTNNAEELCESAQGLHPEAEKLPGDADKPDERGYESRT